MAMVPKLVGCFASSDIIYGILLVRFESKSLVVSKIKLRSLLNYCDVLSL